MSKNIPIGIDNFGELISPETNYQFVDKSLFIQEIIDNAAKVILITRPRRWGKTLNLSMLEYFLSNEINGLRLPSPTQRHIDALKIASVNQGEYLKHLGQYPVIFISFKDIKENTFEEAIHKIRNLIRNVFERYETDILHSIHLSEHKKRRFSQYLEGHVDTPTMEDSLLLLSQWLFEHYQGKKVYILIDEYDTPLNMAYVKEYVNEMTLFMKNLFSAALKGNHALQKGVMTGVLRISKDSMLSGLNNIQVHSLFDPTYATHFGFSDTEVQQLFNDCKLAHDIEHIRQYYNGYHIGGQQCYNPWSIINCIKNKGNVQPYWVNTADDAILKKLILESSSAIKEQMTRLLDAENSHIQGTISTTIRFEDFTPSDEIALWSLLVATGYLTPIQFKQSQNHYFCTLAIPNEEVKSVYTTIFMTWISTQLGDATYRQLLTALIQGHVEIFTQQLENYLLIYSSHHDFTHESHYHTFLLGLFCGLMDTYHIYSNLETGLGRADFMLSPKKPSQNDFAIILELKHMKTATDRLQELAREGLQQISSQKYTTFLERNASLTRILQISIAFSGKTAASCYHWHAL